MLQEIAKAIDGDAAASERFACRGCVAELEEKGVVQMGATSTA